MPRVLRIINRLNLGGPTYNAAYLTKYLAPEFETRLIAGIKEHDEDSSEFIVEKMGLTPEFIPEMKRDINISNDWIAYGKIKKIISEFKPDIVHTHAAKAGTLGRLAAFNMGVPVILHTFHGHVFHSYFHPVKTAVFKSIERYLGNRSTRIIAISDIQKHEICTEHRVCNPDKTVVIPLGFDLGRFQQNQDSLRSGFRNQYGITNDIPVVAIIGRIAPVKNHEFFIRCLAKVKEKYQGRFAAFVVGDGDTRNNMESLAESLNLRIATPEKMQSDADIYFTSWIRDVERPLAGSDIVVMTSLNEGTPVSLIEAQAAGIPVVSTEVGGIGNAVLPGKSALLSPPGDSESFISNMLRLLQDKQLRSDMGAAGRPFVLSHFHYERLVNDTRTLYRTLLNSRE